MEIQFQVPAAYTVVKAQKLPDIHAEGILLKHNKSGARLLLIPCEDENKVFNIAFRTPPTDSTGVAHIIEHTVLCGSEHYPLKDPFVELVKGSLNTFLNAITYPDKTMYPVASTNSVDFRNLMHVYLDSVFYPNIYHEQNIFRQEGWHYELTDPAAPLTLNGVVYNEMKGAFSSPDEVLEREIMNALFPDTAYGVESGGHPEHIPELTYEDYLDFHRRYYHPSNSYIYLYGDMDMEDQLLFLDREYLSAFDTLAVDSALKRQTPFASEHCVSSAFPISSEEELEKNTYLSWSAAAGNALDVSEIIAFGALDYALLSAPGAPVKQALLDAGIGLDVYGGFSDGLLQPYFSVVAKNAERSDADRFREVIRETLQQQVRDGVNRASLKAGLSSMEFTFREADYGNYPKGLIYGMSVMDTWLYDEEAPFLNLCQLEIYKRLNELVDTGYFEQLIEEKLLHNPHSALVMLTPELGLAEERERKTAEKLAAIRDSLDDAQLQALIEETKALRAWQEEEESEEALATLPVLKRSDIRRKVSRHINEERSARVTLRDGSEAVIPTVLHPAACNGIGYLQLFFDAGRIPAEDLPYLGFLKAVLTSVSTEHYSYQELSNAICSETGGISSSLTTVDLEAEPGAFRTFLEVRMKALASKLSDGAELLHEILAASVYDDEKRIREILSQTRSQLQVSLMNAGHAAAVTRVSAYTAADGVFLDQVSSLGFYRFIRDLEADFEARREELFRKLKGLAASVLRPDNLLVSFTCDEDSREVLPGLLGAIFDTVPAAPLPAARTRLEPYGPLNEAFTTAGQVQYVAMGGSFASSGVPYTGAAAVFRQIMSYDYLWMNVRVKGGAYGCGAGLKRNRRGSFYSYRDPHLLRTRQVFLDAPAYLAAFDADEETMTKYVIGTFSGIDTPLNPSAYGAVCMREYISGMTEDMRQRFRDEVLGTTAEEIRALAGAVEAALSNGCICVVGGETKIAEHADAFRSVTPLL